MNNKKYQFDPKRIFYSQRLIKEAHNILLLAHHNPDGDSLSACAALEYALRAQGKCVETAYPGGHVESVPITPAPLYNASHTIDPDILINCDGAHKDRLYLPSSIASCPLINIDHHISNSINGTVNLVAPEASSTCELVAQLLELWNMPYSQEIAQALLFGIMQDTQVFRTSNTTATTLNIVSALLDAGADITQLKAYLTQHSSPTVIKLWGDLYRNIQCNASKTAIWVVCDKQLFAQHHLDETALLGFINTLANITTIDVCILFYEQSDGLSKVSLRSQSTDVNAIAQQFGGGGHVNAAGITSTEALTKLVMLVTQLL